MRYSYDNQTLSKEAFLEHFRHHEVYKYRIRTYFSPTETPPYNKIRRALFEVFAVSKTYWKKELMTFLSDESIVEFESTE